MNEDITALRAHLFATIAALRDTEKPMDIERAKTISAVAQTIINSAKVEVEYLGLTKQRGTGFLPLEGDTTKTQTGTKTVSTLPNGQHLTTHKIA